MEYKRPSNEIIIEAIMECYGIISDAALKIQVSRQTLAKWIKEDQELFEATQDGREHLVDHVESKLIASIDKGNPISQIFALKCLGKRRGWIDQPKQEIEITNKSIKITFSPQNAQEFKEAIGTNQPLELEANLE